MSSVLKPYEGFDPEDHSLTTPMGSSICLMSLYSQLKDNYHLYQDQIGHAYSTLHHLFSTLQILSLVIGPLLECLSPSQVLNIPDPDMGRETERAAMMTGASCKR